MKKKRTALIVFSVLILLTLAYIWHNSMESIPVSQSRSSDLLEKLQPVLDAAFGPGKITENFLRKTAHFLEFCLLGIELRLFCWLLGQKRLQGQLNALAFSLAAAVTDETIQIHSGRGSSLKDVCLDFSGAFLGALAVFLAALLIELHRRRKQAQGATRQ